MSCVSLLFHEKVISIHIVKLIQVSFIHFFNIKQYQSCFLPSSNYYGIHVFNKPQTKLLEICFQKNVPELQTSSFLFETIGSNVL